MNRAIQSLDQELSGRIGKLMRLTGLPVSSLMVNATDIMPVLEVGRLLQTPEIEITQTVGLSGTGVQTIYTVDDSSVEHIFGWDLERASGDRTFNAIYIYDASGTDFLRVDSVTATARDSRLLNTPIILRPRWTIRVNVLGGSVDSQWDARMLKNCERAWLS
jgi:hypothetical protein